MVPLVASATQLPFLPNSFDVVIASDVLEHVAPQRRTEVIAEVLRVARQKAVFCFPCGLDAFALDQKLLNDYLARGLQPPVWLQEHMLHPFPDQTLFQSLPAGWTARSKSSEKLSFHYWLMRKEMHRRWRCAFRLALLVFPGIVRRLLRTLDDEPSYRMIFVVNREGQLA